MANTYNKSLNRKVTPQSQPIPGSDQVKNNAGGYAFAVDMWKRLERFLILGSEGGTYYVKEQELTQRNANNILACLKSDGKRTVDTIVDVSVNGRAPKQDPTLFALAVASSYGDASTKNYALSLLYRVARTGSQFLRFVDFVNGMRGWGRGLRTHISNWYNNRDADSLAYQAVKYQNRYGWTHRDVLRLAHTQPASEQHDAVYSWIVNGNLVKENAPRIIYGYELAQNTNDADDLIKIISDYGLTREMIPNTFLNDANVWEALFEKMPLTAMIRNLGKMSQVGFLSPMSDASVEVVRRLNDEDYIKRSRIHPLNTYLALATYSQGKGFRGSLSWSPVPQVVSALEDAFYLSFDNVEPSGKRFFLGLDVSGSMSVNIANMPISAREATALMAMVTVRTEPNYITKAFTNTGKSYGSRNGWYSRGGIADFLITPKMDLRSVADRMYRTPFGGTDCALPMLDALHNKIPVDVFVVYTDSETWAGGIHPTQALKQYRDTMGIPAKLVVVGMTSNGFSIADPNDVGMLDVVGFDTRVPRVISEFALE